jgi:hypothetical protein
MNESDPYRVRRFEIIQYDRTITHRIDPVKYRCPDVAAELADLFIPIYAEVVGSTQGVIVGMRSFLDWLSEDTGPIPHSLAEVTATHIQGWERSLDKHLAEFPTQEPYNKFVHLRALLLRISQDEPNRVHPTLHALLNSPIVTTIPEMRPVGGLAPFTADEHRRILHAAYRDVVDGLRLVADGQIEHLSRRMPAILPALHVLLSIGTGEPPEVLRKVLLGDIWPLVPAAEMTTPADDERAAWLQGIALSRPSGFYVQLRKNRAHTLYNTLVTRRNRHSCFALEASLAITAPFRIPGGSNALWVDEQGRHAWFQDLKSLSSWLKSHGINVDGAKAFARFRKAVVGAEAMASPAAYLAMAQRHRAGTFFRSYAANEVLRAHSGRILMRAIESAFEEAIQPTVVTPEDIRRIEQGSIPNHLRLNADEQSALLAGDMEGPHAACRDPLHSPFDRVGEACGSSATGLCFVCPNAVITERHLPALVYFANHLNPHKAGDIEAWQRTWEPVWTAITQGILPRFDNALVEQARSLVDDVYVDIGVRQDLAALEVEP